MSEPVNLWLYFLVVSGVIILPGMDMAFVMGCSLSGGRRAGFAAVAGIVAGGICHMLIAVTGISVLLKIVPAALSGMLLFGAAYLAWIGWTIIRAGNFSGPEATSGAPKPMQSFFGAMATCLLNPKAYIFMLAIFPQFVHADGGSIWGQASILSMITAITQVVIYGGLTLIAVQTHAAISSRPRVNAWLAKGVGLVLIMTAVLSLYGGITGIR